MTIDKIKSPDDVLDFMNENIKYGWLDINNEVHRSGMDNFRKLYRIASTQETLKYGVGTCIEQVKLMSELLNKINVPNKMFCTRVYEGEDFDNLEDEVQVHCFLLYYLNGRVFQLEHPNWERVGIHEFSSEEEAIEKINEYYVKKANGKSRPVTEFYEAEPNLTLKEFNKYINSLDKKEKKR